MRPIPSARLVYISVPAGTAPGSKIPFPNVSELRGKQLIGIESLDVTQLSATPNQIPNILAADLPKAVLNMRRKSKDKQYRWPLTSLNILFTAGIWKEVEPYIPDYQKSEVEFFDTPAVTAFSVAFIVYYIDLVVERS